MNKNNKKEQEWSEFIAEVDQTEKILKNKEKISEIRDNNYRYSLNQYKKEKLLQNIDEAIIGGDVFITDTGLGSKYINAGKKGNNNSCDVHTIRALQKGKLKIDLRIDLHGYTINEAQEVFTYIIRNMYANHQKVLLVVTGKNKATWTMYDQNQPTIRSELVNWVNMPELSGYIKYVQQAKEKDGGGGAFYVLIHKNIAR